MSVNGDFIFLAVRIPNLGVTLNPSSSLTATSSLRANPAGPASKLYQDLSPLPPPPSQAIRSCLFSALLPLHLFSTEQPAGSCQNVSDEINPLLRIFLCPALPPSPKRKVLLVTSQLHTSWHLFRLWLYRLLSS